MKSKTRFAPQLGDRLNSDGSNVERISRTEKNGAAKGMRPNKFGRWFVEEASEIVVVTVYTYYF